MPKGEAPTFSTPTKKDQLEEAHQLLLEIKQAQLEATILFQGVEAQFTLMCNIANRLVKIGHFTLEDVKLYQIFKIAPYREKAPKVISWLRADSRLIRVEEPSTPSDLPSLISPNSLGSLFEIECSPIQTNLSILACTLTDKMAEPSIPVSEIEKMIEKIVATSFEKLMISDKGKEKVVIEDDEEAKDES
ncbi:hypothetical protein JCGZ_18111 [Jatropha curcas]|uniref:Uncharacterized protein n=1 Tax=Jatropha curcas TaxID=180498 RepID=A0A067KD38_JATCU|nr:hypothetical protein JCGZ_18111 [Jatropha curcas]